MLTGLTTQEEKCVLLVRGQHAFFPPTLAFYIWLTKLRMPQVSGRVAGTKSRSEFEDAGVLSARCK
jgi:hypothetical protein